MTIPKKFLTYWEGNQLSLLHYYTIYSLIKYNPEVDILIYTSSVTSTNLIQWHTSEHSIVFNTIVSLDTLKEINPDKIHIIPIDFETTYGIDTQISVVFKADFIRIAKLHEHGGMWFDMDILFIKPIPKQVFESDVDFYYYTYSQTIPTGLMFVSPNKGFLKDLYANALSIIQNIKTSSLQNYQVLGPNLWKSHFNNFTKNCIAQCLKTSDIYPYDCDSIPELYSNKNMLEDNTFGIHWYNGHLATKQYINRFNIANISPESNIIIEKLLFNVIHH